MAFDVTDPNDLLALKNEQALDPLGMGYAAVAGQTQLTLDLFNDAALNVGAPTINKPTEELDIPEIAAVVDPAEYAALQEYDKEWLQMFISRAADVLLKPYQAKFLSLFDGASVTRTAVLTLRSKPASRAEILFGVNTIISSTDWFAARDS